MKTYLPYSLILAAAASGMALGAETAYTTPVGYVKLGDTTVGQPSVKANTDVYISIPLDLNIDFQGTVASVAGNVITVSGTPAFGSLTAIPHTVKIGGGTKNGLIALITASTTNTLTVAIPPGDSLTGIVANDKISVSKSWTVLGLMGASIPAGTQVLGFSGAFAGQNPSSDLIYEFDGANWIDTNSFQIADNAVLYPTETMIVRNNSATPITSIVASGQVTVSSNRSVVVSSGTGTDNMSSYFGSVGEAIGTSGLSAVSSAGDQILAFNNNAAGQNKAATTIIEYDGAAWIDTNSFVDVTTTFKLDAGVGYIFRKANGSPAGNSIWTDQPAYVPSL